MSSQSISDYWKNVWRQGVSVQDAGGKQAAVLRVRNGKSIDPESWNRTLEELFGVMRLSKNDVLLDFCCGNGLVAVPAAAIAKKVLAVDINADLVNSIKSENRSNIETIVADVLGIGFETGQFDKIIWYSSIQYFDDGDIVRMFRRLHQWLKPGGVALIGDIPDRERIWKYFYNAEGERRYFEGLSVNQPVIGNWIDREWLGKLSRYSGFSDGQILVQDPKLIYADFRYDFLLTK